MPLHNSGPMESEKPREAQALTHHPRPLTDFPSSICMAFGFLVLCFALWEFDKAVISIVAALVLLLPPFLISTMR
jgi:hypothetical protein